jgi:ribbon-helix-helix protein, copG family
MVEKEKPSKVPLTLRLPRALYEELKEEAEFRGLSLHEYILVKLNPLAVEFEQG